MSALAALRRLVAREEADAAERGNAVLAAQINDELDREAAATGLRLQMHVEHPDLKRAVTRRRRMLR